MLVSSLSNTGLLKPISIVSTDSSTNAEQQPVQTHTERDIHTMEMFLKQATNQWRSSGYCVFTQALGRKPELNCGFSDQNFSWGLRYLDQPVVSSLYCPHPGANRKSCPCHTSHLPEPWSLLLSVSMCSFLPCLCECAPLRESTFGWSVKKNNHSVLEGNRGGAQPLGAASGAFKLSVSCLRIVFPSLCWVFWRLSDKSLLCKLHACCELHDHCWV